MHEKELKTAVKVACSAGGLLMKMSRGKLAIKFKSSIDMVTEADKASESLIIKAIRQAFPGDDIMTEESQNQRTSSKRRWIIDPLDGTTNYAHNFPVWCVSIAFEEKDQVMAGAIYNPNLNELFTAVKGKGAYLNGKLIKVSSEKNLLKSLLATGFPYDVHTSPENNLENFQRFIKRAQAVRRPGSAAIDMAYLACGRFDGFWEIKLKPWDAASASLMISEAGGRITNFSGGRYSIYYPECLASNGKIHSQMLGVLNKSDGGGTIVSSSKS
jgi:myo-inositol-1(or 4)-monophosphatase